MTITHLSMLRVRVVKMCPDVEIVARPSRTHQFVIFCKIVIVDLLGNIKIGKRKEYRKGQRLKFTANTQN